LIFSLIVNKELQQWISESRKKFEKLGVSFVRTDIMIGTVVQDGQENAEA
jgi:hypothetical protein